MLMVSFVFAWGKTGHRITGEIADTYLTEKTKLEIQKILSDPSLAVASTWADEMRSNPDFRKYNAWHYANMPINIKYAQSKKSSKGDIVQAIKQCKVKLQSAETPTEEKAFYLRFLVHLVGDIHQPLHVGKGEDRGGNDVKVKFFWEKSNLHRVWDSGIIEGKELSFSEITNELDRADKEDIERWQKGTVVDWAVDAQSLHPQVYAFEDADKLGYEYSYQNWPLVQQQLLKGGLRLAAVLNEVFG